MLSDWGLFCLAVGNFCRFVGPLTFAIASDSLARDTVCNRELFTPIILRMLMSPLHVLIQSNYLSTLQLRHLHLKVHEVNKLGTFQSALLFKTNWTCIDWIQRGLSQWSFSNFRWRPRESSVNVFYKIQHLQQALYLERAWRSACGRQGDFWVPKPCGLSDWKHNGRLIATHWYVCGTKMGQRADSTMMGR